jgi:lysophospholipase
MSFQGFHDRGYLASARGAQIYRQGWFPEGEVRATVLFIHGLGEHSDRYERLAGRLVADGIACLAFDLRGHGRSTGRRGHIVRFADYLADVDAARSELQRRRPGVPLFLLGHSLGGLILLRYLLENPQGIAGGVLSSPYLGDLPEMAPPKIVTFLARLLSRLCPILPFKTGIRPDRVSRDPEEVRAYREDPRIFDTVTPRFYTETQRAQEEVHAAASTFPVPLLLMQSGADRLVDPQATRRWAKAAPQDLVDFVEWEGFYHEMFNEPEADRERVLARVKQWLQEGKLQQ